MWLSGLLILSVGVSIILSKPPRIRARKIKQVRVKKKSFGSIIDLGMVFTEVSTRLSSGATVGTAWALSLQDLTDNFNSRIKRSYWVKQEKYFVQKTEPLEADGVPTVLWNLWLLPKWKYSLLGFPSALRESLPAAFAVCRLGANSGAPLAEVLDACAQGVTEAGEARSARKIALAAPLTSAKMLATLPLIGILFSYLMGVNALHFLFNSWLGYICLGCGIGFELAGLWGVYRLVQKAVRE